jgi:hypothetical protein
VFALEKFYKYVFGQKIEIFTDHKPLIGMLGFKKGEPPVVASRLQRYLMRLSIFDFEVKYRKGKENGNADMLSRLPVNEKQSVEDEKEEKVGAIREMMSEGKFVLNVEKIREETNNDVKLRKLKFNLMNGWNEGVSKELKHYYEKNDELGIDCGCLLMGDRVIIPSKLKFAVLKVLHQNHMGISKMKIVARKYVYWEGITKDIEKVVQECEVCQKLRKDDQTKIVGSWPEPKFPFDRIHIDFFFFRGREFLILVDAYSRWLEVKLMKNTIASSVLKELQNIFVTFGYCRELVSDNGPPFSSHEFKTTLESWGIRVTKSPPFNPQSNGIVERAVQTAKSVLRKFVEQYSYDFQLNEALAKFLINYRNSPCTRENFTPSERIFGFTPRTELSKLKLDRENVTNYDRIQSKKQELSKDKGELKAVESIQEKKIVEFKEGENILYISRAPGHVVGIKGKIVKRISQLTYLIEIEGKQKFAHVNQLRKSVLKSLIFNIPNNNNQSTVQVELSSSAATPAASPKGPQARTKATTNVEPTRKSKRTRKEVDRLRF